MVYEELKRRYGNYIATRLHHELNPEEFARAKIDDLTRYLESRAELAHEHYRQVIDDPLVILNIKPLTNNKKIETLYDVWRDAEDLASLIAIAEDVYGSALVNSKT